MEHGGDIYGQKIKYDFSVSLNPFPPADEIMEAGIRGLESSRAYPDIKQRNIRNIISEKEGVPSSSVLAGNGASELLLGIVKYINPTKALLMEPCYSGYRYVLNALDGCRVISCSLKEENGFIPVSAELDDIWKEKPELVFLTDPWNPSGRNISDDVLEDFLKRADKEETWVIIDESFLLLSEKALGKRSVTKSEILNRYPRIVVITSYTKFLALPGVRMGYMIARSEVIDGVRRLLPEWNLSIPAEYIMEAGLRKAGDRAYLEAVVLKIREEREYLIRELNRLGLKTYDSNTCFIYFTGPAGLQERLISVGILIRSFDEEGYYRIGIKEHIANMFLIDMLNNICKLVL